MVSDAHKKQHILIIPQLTQAMIRKLLVSITFCLFSLTGFAQHLTYTDLIKIGKMKSITAVSEYVSPRGYDYAGAHQKDSTIVVRWTKSCWITSSSFSDYSFEWTTGVPRSLLQLIITPETNTVSLELPSKSAFNTLKASVKSNGFKFKKEDISGGDFIQIFERIKDAKLEWFVLTQKATGYFYCTYLP